MRFLSTLSTRGVLLLAGLLIQLTGPPPALAATLFVNPFAPTGSNANNNQCLQPGKPCLTIAYAVGKANNNDVIMLVSSPAVAFGDANVAVTKNLTFEGSCQGNCPDGRVKHNARHVGQHFVIGVNTTVTLRNLELYGGGGQSGGSIFNFGTLTLENCRMRANAAAANGGGIYNDGGVVVIRSTEVLSNVAHRHGGGVYNAEGGTLTVTDGSVLDHNIADDSGGGIYTTTGNTSVTIEGSSITFNTAGAVGGGIYVDENATLTIASASLFEGNRARDDGGAVFNTGGDVSSTQASFIANVAMEGSGGAILNTGEGSVAVTRTDFAWNQATVAGGAVADAGTGPFSISQSYFSLNSADHGGAVHIASAQGPSTVGRAIEAVTFDTNGAGTDGGALDYGPLDGELTIVNSTFSRNFSGTHGGAIYNNSVGGSGRIVIAFATFFGNAASEGATIYNGQPLEMNHSIVADSDDLDAGDPDNACFNLHPISGTGNLVGLVFAPAVVDLSCNSSASFNAGTVTGIDSGLRDNDGPVIGAFNVPTLTHQLFVGSNAIDAITRSACLAPDGLELSFDQRQASRLLPTNDPNATCAVGAYELDPP